MGVGLRSKMKNVIGLIPSRLGSKRLPGKALAKISDIPVIVHVAKRAQLSKLLNRSGLVAIPTVSPFELTLS